MPCPRLTSSPALPFLRYVAQAYVLRYGGSMQGVSALNSFISPIRSVCVSVPLRIPQESCGIDVQSATCGHPGGDEAEQHHGEDDGGEHERVSGAGKRNQARKDARGQQPANETDATSAEQNNDGTAERGADDLVTLRAKGDANALLLHAL